MTTQITDKVTQSPAYAIDRPMYLVNGMLTSKKP